MIQQFKQLFLIIIKDKSSMYQQQEQDWIEPFFNNRKVDTWKSSTSSITAYKNIHLRQVSYQFLKDFNINHYNHIKDIFLAYSSTFVVIFQDGQQHSLQTKIVHYDANGKILNFLYFKQLTRISVEQFSNRVLIIFPYQYNSDKVEIIQWNLQQNKKIIIQLQLNYRVMPNHYKMSKTSAKPFLYQDNYLYENNLIAFPKINLFCIYQFSLKKDHSLVTLTFFKYPLIKQSVPVLVVKQKFYEAYSPINSVLKLESSSLIASANFKSQSSGQSNIYIFDIKSVLKRMRDQKQGYLYENKNLWKLYEIPNYFCQQPHICSTKLTDLHSINNKLYLNFKAMPNYQKIYVEDHFEQSKKKCQQLQRNYQIIWDMDSKDFCFPKFEIKEDHQVQVLGHFRRGDNMIYCDQTFQQWYNKTYNRTYYQHKKKILPIYYIDLESQEILAKVEPKTTIVELNYPEIIKTYSDIATDVEISYNLTKSGIIIWIKRMQYWRLELIFAFYLTSIIQFCDQKLIQLVLELTIQ